MDPLIYTNSFGEHHTIYVISKHEKEDCYWAFCVEANYFGLWCLPNVK